MFRADHRLSIFLLLAVADTAFAFGIGINGYSGREGVGCNVCHAPLGAAPTVTIDGPAQLAPGATAEYTLNISGGVGTRAGTNIAASPASVVLAPSGPDLRVVLGELTHSTPALFAGSAAFRFRVTAPAGVASFTLFASGQRTDGVAPTGDASALVSRVITVQVPQASPPVVSVATATPASVTGTNTALNVTATDDGGEPALTYAWSAPTAPAPVTFSVNNSNAAKNATATFTRAGTYVLRVTVRDAQNGQATRDVNVTVVPTTTALSVAPASIVVQQAAQQTFTATAADQFGQAVAPAPTVVWSVSGGGVIAPTGIFTAGNAAGGPFTVTALAEGRTATALVTVAEGGSPAFAQVPAAQPARVTGTTSVLSVLGTDDGGEAGLVYSWSATGPAAVTFGENGNNAAKQTVATFTAPGDYIFSVIARDAQARTATATLPVRVDATLSALSLSPAQVVLAPGESRRFSVESKDQFRQAFAAAPSLTWSTTGGGTVDESGLYVAGSAAGGPFAIEATAGNVRGTATVSIGKGNTPVDEAPPVVSLLAPLGEALGAALSGEVELRVEVEDDVAVGTVEYLLDGAPIGRSTTAPWSITFDTRVKPNGSYQLTASATDASGNVTRSAPLVFAIDNPLRAGPGADALVAGTTACGADAAGATAAAPGWLVVVTALGARALRTRLRGKKRQAAQTDGEG